MNWRREYPPDTRRTSWPRGTLILVFWAAVLLMLIIMRAIDPPEAGTLYNAEVNAGSVAVGAFWALEVGIVILAIARVVKAYHKAIRNAASSAATLKTAKHKTDSSLYNPKTTKINRRIPKC